MRGESLGLRTEVALVLQIGEALQRSSNRKQEQEQSQRSGDAQSYGRSSLVNRHFRGTFLNQPGQAQIQSDLFYDYRTNVDAYPKWQAWMREKQPRLFVAGMDARETTAFARYLGKV